MRQFAFRLVLYTRKYEYLKNLGPTSQKLCQNTVYVILVEIYFLICKTEKHAKRAFILLEPRGRIRLEKIMSVI